jgi:MFS family permease
VWVTQVKARLVTPAFLLIAFATLAYFIAEGALIPTVPLYVAGPLGGGEVAVGVVVGAFAVTALLLRPWAGRLADRRGRRFVMLVGMVLFGASVAGYLVAESIPVMVAMRLVTGAGAAVLLVGAAPAPPAIPPAPPPGRAGGAAPPGQNGQTAAYSSTGGQAQTRLRSP